MEKHLSFRDLERSAQELSLKVLKEAPALAHFKNDPNLGFVTLVEDGIMISQIYICRGKRSDATVLTSASVSCTTGEVLSVHIHV